VLASLVREGTVGQREAQKARGRNRITGNLSVRSRPLAPPQHRPRIAIAGDIPPGSCKPSGRQIDYTEAGAASNHRSRGRALARKPPGLAGKVAAAMTGAAVWCLLTRRSRNRGLGAQPFSLRRIGNLDDPSRHGLVPVLVGQPLASEQRQRNNFGVWSGVMPEVYTKRLEVAPSGQDTSGVLPSWDTPRRAGEEAAQTMKVRRLAVHGGLVRPSVYIRRSKVTISLEPSIWEAFQEIAAEQGKTVSELVAEIERTRVGGLAARC
jgi:hypothetical protein